MDVNAHLSEEDVRRQLIFFKAKAQNVFKKKNYFNLIKLTDSSALTRISVVIVMITCQNSFLKNERIPC